MLEGGSGISPAPVARAVQFIASRAPSHPLEMLGLSLAL